MLTSSLKMFVVLFLWERYYHYFTFFFRFHHSLKPACLCLQRYELLLSWWFCDDSLLFSFSSLFSSLFSHFVLILCSHVIWFIQVRQVLEEFEYDFWFLAYSIKSYLHFTMFIFSLPQRVFLGFDQDLNNLYVDNNTFTTMPRLQVKFKTARHD